MEKLNQQLNIKKSRLNLSEISKDIMDALRGNEKDFTTGSINKAIFILAVPMVLEMLMESVFAIADIFYVSKLGAEAIATVGITESLITIVYALGIGLSTGVSAMVSRRIGEKRYGIAAQSAYQAIVTGIFISLLIAVPGIIFAKDILRLMGAEPVIIEQMSGYTSVMLGGNLSIILLFIINGVFRSAGNPVLSMYVLAFANGINIILDPLLIFGIGPFPEMGVEGAAVATTIGRSLAVLLQLYLLIKGKGRIKFKGIKLLPDKALIKRLLDLSWGSISQYIVATSSWIILVRIIAIYGSDVLAGYTIALRIVVFALLPCFGISNAASTLVGQNLGAERHDRAEKSVWIVGRTNMITMGILGLILVIFPVTFLGIFSSSDAIIKYGAEGLRIISLGFISYGLGMVMVSALNGAGDTRTPFRINVLSFWMFEIPLAWLLSNWVGWEQHGVYFAIIIAESMMTLFAYLAFKKGKWKLKEV
ncbi:MATE family efflux transporter [Saccharicrinis sp. FJH54]|uniref:MATE family efflux transporter n=1 Tax=Saccharicrinis sp. FJH54 TaxID=3344665 RepID=UPI0035D40EDE